MWQRFGVEAPTVERHDFLTEYEAYRALRLLGGPLSVGALKIQGVLQPAFLSDGTEGVTRASVEAELEWRRRSPLWRRCLRRLRRWARWL